MKILLVGNYLPDRQKSMAAFAQMMERALVAHGHSVELVNPPEWLLPRGVVAKGLFKWIAYLDKYLYFPFLLRRLASNYDLVHICDHSNALYTLFLKNYPTVVTCHDVLAIEAARNLIPGIRVGYTGKSLQWLIFKGLNGAGSVVCDSEYTKEHLINLGWSGGNISVALLALNNHFSPATDQQIKNAKLGIGLNAEDRYLLHVGSDLPRKNRFFVLKVFNELIRTQQDNTLKVLFLGPKLSEEMKQFVHDNNLTQRVISIQDVSHDLMMALYSGAVANIFPSLQEGFGWPVIEAQACGCPVITSNLSPMTEVGGDGAIYVDPYDVNAATNVIYMSLGQLDTIRKKGFDNVKKFSIQNMITVYQASYIRTAGKKQ